MPTNNIYILDRLKTTKYDKKKLFLKPFLKLWPRKEKCKQEGSAGILRDKIMENKLMYIQMINDNVTTLVDYC